MEDLQRTLHAKGLAGRVHHLGYVPAADLIALIDQATALVIPRLMKASASGG